MCRQCNYSTNWAFVLRIHMTNHSGEKNHKCAQCTKSFSQASTLKTHLLTHSGEKNNTCAQCSKLFSFASALKRHLLSEQCSEQCSPILGVKSTVAHNAIIQPINLVILDFTLCRTLEKSLINAISVTFLQSNQEIWSCTKWPTPEKSIINAQSASFLASEVMS